jgi:hypothetical protein
MDGKKGGESDLVSDFFPHNFKKPEERIDLSPCGTEGCWWIEDFSWLDFPEEDKG